MMDIMNVVAILRTGFAESDIGEAKKLTDDVASVIANALIDGEHLPALETNGYYMIIATAGHDTTSSSTAGAISAYAKPEQMNKLRTNPAAYGNCD